MRSIAEWTGVVRTSHLLLAFVVEVSGPREKRRQMNAVFAISLSQTHKAGWESRAMGACTAHVIPGLVPR